MGNKDGANLISNAPWANVHEEPLFPLPRLQYDIVGATGIARDAPYATAIGAILALNRWNVVSNIVTTVEPTAAITLDENVSPNFLQKTSNTISRIFGAHPPHLPPPPSTQLTSVTHPQKYPHAKVEKISRIKFVFHYYHSYLKDRVFTLI